MKKYILLLALFFTAQMTNAQAFSGKGDKKLQIGLNLQDGGTGISSSIDFGIGANMSYGFVATYLLNTDEIAGEKAAFENRADFKFRFNANIGNVVGIGPKADIYPGLSLGTRNFGAHLGFRYFFSEGFGLFAEGATPLARYDNDVKGFEHLNNQFTLNIGAAFNF